MSTDPKRRAQVEALSKKIGRFIERAVEQSGLSISYVTMIADEETGYLVEDANVAGTTDIAKIYEHMAKTHRDRERPKGETLQ